VNQLEDKLDDFLSIYIFPEYGKLRNFLSFFPVMDLGGASEMEAPMEIQQVLEMQAFRISPPIEIDPTPIDPIIVNPHNPELQFFPTAEGFYDYQRKCIFTNMEII
jgi:hypothetical protein